MSTNLNQFGLYAAAILNNLYEVFPIRINISIDDLINEYIAFEAFWRLQHEASTLNSMVAILETANMKDEEMRVKGQEKLQRIQNDIRAQSNEIKKQKEIVEGTLNFLESEGYIKNDGEGRYQLSVKGFVHLNKEFKDSKIIDVHGTVISLMKDTLSNPGKMGNAIAAGNLLLSIGTKFLVG